MGRGVSAASGDGVGWGAAPPPAVAPVAAVGGDGDREGQWKSFYNSVNAVSFGFVATAILISMFLVMAIFERLLRPRSAGSGGGGGSNLDARMRVQRKLDSPSPEMSVYARGVSVLMPGEEVPTFIAHPVPTPSQPRNQPVLSTPSVASSTRTQP